MKYFNYDGVRIIQDMHDEHAMIFQHEFDHLNGILMEDKAKMIKTNSLWAEYKKKLKQSENLSRSHGRKMVKILRR